MQVRENIVLCNLHDHYAQDQQNWWWGPQSVSYEGQLFFLLISRRVEAGSDRGFFNFWLWMAGSEARAGAFRSVDHHL